MASQSTTALLQTNWDKFERKNTDYMKDENIPPQIYELVENYRERAREMKPGNDLGMLIDDFFTEVNNMLKDVKLREIARIKNENDVEVNKLKRIIRSIKEPERIDKSKSRSVGKRPNTALFVDNDIAKVQ